MHGESACMHGESMCVVSLRVWPVSVHGGSVSVVSPTPIPGFGGIDKVCLRQTNFV